MRMLLSLTLALGLAFSPPALAADAAQPAQAAAAKAAPFGLTWGLGKAEIEALGVELKPSGIEKYGTAFMARNLPKAVSGLESIFLFFGHDDRLWRVAAASGAYDNDPYGYSVRARYDELKGLLDERYGKGESFHQAPENEFMRGDDNFVYSIHSGHRHYFTSWQAQDMDIELGIRTSDMNTTFWSLLYISKTEEARFEKANKAQEKDAL